MLTVDYDLLDIRAGHLVLDLGCGAGRHTYEALRRGAHVVFADLEHSLLGDVRNICAGMALQGEVGRVTAAPAVADATRLPFRDGAFDRVIVSEVLEHVPADSPALAEIARVLRPDGRLAVTVPRWWPERVCWALSDDYHSNEGGHVRIYRRSVLMERVQRAGLEPRASHHAHALHSPYWWIKCLVGVDNDEAPPAKAYRRFLEWQIVAQPPGLNLVERALNPVLGKSLVLYADKNGSR